MRPRIHIPLAPGDRAASVSRRMMIMCALIVSAVAVHAMFYQDADANMQSAAIHSPALAPACIQWHQAASAVVARLAQSTRDSDLRQANDAIFRMRRARKNCEEGWFTLACQDYYAIARSLRGYANVNNESLLACRRPAERMEDGGRPIR